MTDADKFSPKAPAFQAYGTPVGDADPVARTLEDMKAEMIKLQERVKELETKRAPISH